jgi:hypothetical protein
VPILLSMIAGLSLAACAPRGEGARPAGSVPTTTTTPGGADTTVAAPAATAAAGGEAPIEFGVLGRIVDATGKPVQMATVGAEVLDAQSGPIPEIGVLTNEKGEFHWPLRPGRYRLTPYLEGVKMDPQEVVVEAGKATRVTFTVRAK